jgi:hypothetical protein
VRARVLTSTRATHHTPRETHTHTHTHTHATGVDSSLKDNSGRTARQLALDKGSDDVLRQLDALTL